MAGNSQLLNDITKGLCLLLFCFMGWQQWKTFSVYQEKFSSPVEFTSANYGKDDITQYENRFVEVKKMFNKSARLSYMGEPVVPNNGTREMHYALTQYYLAPNLLFRNSDAKDSVVFNNGASPVTASDVHCDTILYNLYSTIHINPATNYHLNHGWHVVNDFNNGIIILAK